MHSFSTRVCAAIAFIALFFGFALPANAAATGVVRGQVTVHGTPTAGATVTLRGAQTSISTTTDAKGNYSFPLVPFGRYTITAHVENQPDATEQVEVATDATSTVALAISPLHVIAQSVVTPTSRGVSGSPTSENIMTHSEIQALPQDQSLNRLIETMPGIVQFSYDEPVAHGFHGVTYEIDGAPLPLATDTNFAQVIDPSIIDSLEVITGDFPAEYGGQRQGAVVNIITRTAADIPNGAEISAGIGTYGTTTGSFYDGTTLGNTHLFVSGDLGATNRGLDSPTENAIHDDANHSTGFFRSITNLGNGNTIAFDLGSQYNAFQIPINTAPYSYDTVVNSPTQDDVQREYSSFSNINFTHTFSDGSGYFQIIPWWRYARTVYAGDLPQDVQAYDVSPSDCAPEPAPCFLGGLSQDREATYYGLRLVYFHSSAHNNVKSGVDLSGESSNSADQILLAGSAPFYDISSRYGRNLGAYVEDTWTPSSLFSLQAGLRYDFSNGYVEGNELQPRVGMNYKIGPDTIFHAFYGRVYAAPTLEDTRREAVLIGGGSPSTALPVYDLKPEHDSYYELGLGQTFRNGLYGYANVWERNAWNVLDTTQIFPTPIFAVYNNSLGVAKGVELRLEQHIGFNMWYLSGTDSESEAGGISGGTFLFPPDAISDISLEPEDHDQTVAIKDGYIAHFGTDHVTYASLGSDYGTGYPVQFQNGTGGRLMPHLTFDATIGRPPHNGELGWSLSALN
ncbi:MAG TPA: TonB-dependent receptor, partial [Candidatus Acidoferrales bacterium]|nr:TonB-dependent receptor [Candidatus Acidoferrales bacterium]